MKTFEEARAEVAAIREADPGLYTTMRHEASQQLSGELRDWLGEDHGHGISSSDVSIKVIEMFRAGEMEV